jgi:hypothetical protein
MLTLYRKLLTGAFIRVTEDSMELASVFVDSTIAPHLAELPRVDSLSVSQAAHLQQLIANNVAGGRYAAVNLWSPSGELIYRTEPVPAAKPQCDRGLRAALAGQVFTEATDSVHGAPASNNTGRFLVAYFQMGLRLLVLI